MAARPSRTLIHFSGCVPEWGIRPSWWQLRPSRTLVSPFAFTFQAACQSGGVEKPTQDQAAHFYLRVHFRPLSVSLSPAFTFQAVCQSGWGHGGANVKTTLHTFASAFTFARFRFHFHPLSLSGCVPEWGRGGTFNGGPAPGPMEAWEVEWWVVI